jgi:hypothetical protein
MIAITTTAIVITTKANQKGTTNAPPGPVDRREFVNKPCQRAGGDGAGLPSTSKRRASVKQRMAGIMAKTRQLAQLR